jgi:hypothetical protein
VTANPTAAWVRRQLLEATPWGRRPGYLLQDRDAVFGGDFAHRAQRLGIGTLLTPVRAPRANAVAERVVRTVRNECLDHVIVVNERHLRPVLAEFVRYYNEDRPHRTLAPETPTPAAGPTAGPVRSRPVLGGLHHASERAARCGPTSPPLQDAAIAKNLSRDTTRLKSCDRLTLRRARPPEPCPEPCSARSCKRPLRRHLQKGRCYLVGPGRFELPTT